MWLRNIHFSKNENGGSGDGRGRGDERTGGQWEASEASSRGFPVSMELIAGPGPNFLFFKFSMDLESD